MESIQNVCEGIEQKNLSSDTNKKLSSTFSFFLFSLFVSEIYCEDSVGLAVV